MHLVLNEVVNQWHQGTEEEAGNDLAVLDGPAVVRAQRKTAQSPWQGSHQIGDHEDVVPVMVIGGSDICPSTTGQSAEDANTSDNLRQSRVGPCGQNIPQKDQSESRTGGDSNEDLEKRPLGVSVTNCCGHGRKPFVGEAVVFILHDLVIVQGDADDQSAEESSISERGMSQRDPFAVELDRVKSARLRTLIA